MDLITVVPQEIHIILLCKIKYMERILGRWWQGQNSFSIHTLKQHIITLMVKVGNEASSQPSRY